MTAPYLWQNYLEFPSCYDSVETVKIRRGPIQISVGKSYPNKPPNTPCTARFIDVMMIMSALRRLQPGGYFAVGSRSKENKLPVLVKKY